MSRPAGQHTIRQHNRALVLRRVADEPGQTRAQLALAAGLTRATVSAVVEELLALELVVEREPPVGLRGRPGSPLELNASGPVAIGLEINVDYTSACVLDLTGAMRAQRSVAVDNAGSTPEVALRRAARLGAASASSLGRAVAGVAIAVPGLVGTDGLVRTSPNLPRWVGVNVAAGWASDLPAPSVVDNEANLAALAEHWYGTRLADFVYVSGEIGVGGGLVVGGELFRGVRGFAGELGHVSVDPRGPMCGCGNRGCLEQVAGQTAVLRGAQAADEDELVQRATRGDMRAHRALRSAAAALGVALGATLNVVDVPAVVLGGFYARVAPWLAEPLSADLARRVVSGAPVEVRASTLAADAAMLGAAGTIIRDIITTAAWPG